MEKENKKATASEKLTKVVAIRISQTDYDIFLEIRDRPASFLRVFYFSYSHLTSLYEKKKADLLPTHRQIPRDIRYPL